MWVSVEELPCSTMFLRLGVGGLGGWWWGFMVCGWVWVCVLFFEVFWWVVGGGGEKRKISGWGVIFICLLLRFSFVLGSVGVGCFLFGVLDCLCWSSGDGRYGCEGC